jgi:exonuclease 3'-5' domain-containing protein 1
MPLHDGSSFDGADHRLDPIVVDTAPILAEIINTFEGLPSEPPSLFIDLEGINLSRHGQVSIMQIHVSPTKRTYLIDIYALCEEVFSTRSENGVTLKGVLESATVSKVFFDVRNDSDALFAHFGISLAGVQDLQLMELATRSFPRRTLCGLARCIERDLLLPPPQRQALMDVKVKGKRLFDPELGGSYSVFNQRPMLDDIKAYCAQDVQILPQLYDRYYRKLTPAWKQKMLSESNARVALSQTATFNGKGQHMALPPKGWK